MLNVSLFSAAWDECDELKVQDKDTWVARTILSLESLDRVEIGMFCTAKSDAVGGLVLAPDPWDAHVGPCVSVFAQYVLPEYRNKGISFRMMREAIKTAVGLRAGVLAFTHRLGPWRYETIYRRLDEKP